MGLTGGVLALCSGQYLAQDRFGHIGGIHARAGNEFTQDGSTQIVGRDIGEGASKAAHWGARGGCNDDVGHEIAFLFMFDRRVSPR